MHRSEPDWQDEVAHVCKVLKCGELGMEWECDPEHDWILAKEL